jgi:hypothetical protein
MTTIWSFKLFNKIKKVYIFTQGGLGNQLFIWNAAHFLIGQDFKVVLVYSKLDKSRIIELYPLLNECQHGVKIIRSTLISHYFNSIDRFTANKNNRMKIVMRYFKTHTLDELSKQTVYKFKRRTILRGYFQDADLVMQSLSIYSNEILFYISELSTKKILSEALKDSSNLQVIHARRGDYMQNKSQIGIIRLDSQLSILDMSNPVKICTDSKKLLSETELKNLNIEVYGEEDFSAWESLAFMSQAKVLVCANSTLSWWGGVLQTRTEQSVYFPKPWTIQPSDLSEKLIYPRLKIYEADFADSA